MSSSKRYTKKENDLQDLTNDLFERTEIPFDKSREEVWKDLSGKIHAGESAGSSTRPVFFRYQRVAVAATLALLLSAGVFSRLYRVKTVCPPGESMTLELPDGSMAELNGNTTLYVHPLWWPLSKKVYQEGEAFFRVKEGRKFTVHTKPGITEVLGTSFTVFARDNRFHVTCHSGRVQVKESSSKHSVTLSTNERADLKKGGAFGIKKVNVDPHSPAWKNRHLVFTSTPFREVMDEVELYYGIQIEYPENKDLVYTGNFKLDQSAEKTLSLICRPFNLTYEKRSESEYRIISSERN